MVDAGVLSSKAGLRGIKPLILLGWLATVCTAWCQVSGLEL